MTGVSYLLVCLAAWIFVFGAILVTDEPRTSGNTSTNIAIAIAISLFLFFLLFDVMHQ